MLLIKSIPTIEQKENDKERIEYLIATLKEIDDYIQVSKQDLPYYTYKRITYLYYINDNNAIHSMVWNDRQQKRP